MPEYGDITPMVVYDPHVVVAIICILFAIIGIAFLTVPWERE